MKRKIICIFAVLLIIVSLFSGCGEKTVLNEAFKDRFVVVASVPNGRIIMDKVEGTLYYFRWEQPFTSGMSVMYNSDGTVMTYEQFTQD